MEKRNKAIAITLFIPHTFNFSSLLVVDPSIAIALQWKHINSKAVQFRQSIVISEKGLGRICLYLDEDTIKQRIARNKLMSEEESNQRAKFLADFQKTVDEQRISERELYSPQ